MTTSIQEVKDLVEKEYREALNLICANHDCWRIKDNLISILAGCYVMGALDMEKEIRKIWNESLEQYEPRQLKQRDNIWATELGGAYIDRYLKMTGEAPSNPPNARSLRKFEAGNLLEWIVEKILQRAGILRDLQTWVSFQYSEMLKVTGKCDFVAGGKVDWDRAGKVVHNAGLPEFFGKATNQIINYFKELR